MRQVEFGSSKMGSALGKWVRIGLNHNSDILQPTYLE